jgi:hypothetical protein
MEQLLGLPMPPPKEPWAQRQQSHYKKEIVWNEMMKILENHPVLRSDNLDRMITKFRFANQIPRPQAEQPQQQDQLVNQA